MEGEGRNAERSGKANPEGETPGVPFPPPLAYAAGFGIGLVLEMLIGPGGLPGWVRIAGAVLGLAAFVALDTSAMIRFNRAGTNPAPFKPTHALVTDGPYRVTRNPMYLGMACLYAAAAFAFDVLFAFAVLPLVLVVIDRLAIAREEPYLERLFGEQYRAYRARVRRWI